MAGGVYMIINKIDGKRYVGSTGDFKVRWTQHLWELCKKTHHCRYLQNAFNKYGKENFEFIIIELVEDLDQLIPREQYWKDFYKSYDPKYGYDSRRIAESNRGTTKSEESRHRSSIAASKQWSDPAIRERMICGIRKGGGMSGKTLSEEAKAKISASLIKGCYKRKHTQKTKDKISAAQMGKSRGPRSPEVCAKISIAQKGRPGKPQSPEIRAKIATTMKEYWAKKKEKNNE